MPEISSMKVCVNRVLSEPCKWTAFTDLARMMDEFWTTITHSHWSTSVSWSLCSVKSHCFGCWKWHVFIFMHTLRTFFNSFTCGLAVSEQWLCYNSLVDLLTCSLLLHRYLWPTNIWKKFLDRLFQYSYKFPSNENWRELCFNISQPHWR